MNKKIASIIFPIAIMILASCSHRIDVSVVNIQKVNSYLPQSVAYCLPQSKIIVELQLTKITEKKGPYADYAEEFLGTVNNIIRQNRTYWQISDVNISTVPVRDTNNLWLITGTKPWIYRVHTTPEGFLASINAEPNVNYQLQWQEEKFVEQSIYESVNQHITVIDRGYKEVYDTVFRIQEFDTTRRVVPIIKKRIIRKSTREQAKEIADEIFTLRDDREALLVGEGDSEYLPDGEALRLMLQGIDQLEQEYLSLFVGTVDKTSYHYKYETVPDIKNTITKQIIFRYSPEYGLLPITDMRGKPVYLEIETIGTTNPLQNFMQNQELLRRIEKIPAGKTGLAYRIPEIAIIRVKVENRLLAQKQVLLPQAGVIAHLPVELLDYGNIQIQFDPRTGALISVDMATE